MQNIIFRRMFQILSLTIICTLGLTMLVYYQYFFRQMQSELRHEAKFIFHNVTEANSDFIPFLTNMPKETRITLIKENGEVLFDNTASINEMGNHAERPEIQDAFSFGEGEAIRLSSTLDIQTFYYAKRLEDGTVIRLARDTNSIVHLLLETLPLLLLMSFFITLIALVFTRRIAQKIIEPINNINLSAPMLNVGIYDELSPLLRRLDHQQREIHEQFHKIEAQKNEFDTIIENITEGLIIVNRNLQILSINNSARQIFSAEKADYNGQHLLRFSHNLELKETAVKAMENCRQDTTINIEDKTYQLIASPVYKKGVLEGAFLIFIDITEKYFAEKMRREFSANVSHELKTPLTSISGFAELIKNSLVKPADIPNFAGKIHSEATRMLALINDIIKISKLDEQNQYFTKEPLDLNQIIQETLNRLHSVAAKKQVDLYFDRQPIPKITAVRALIDELVYNLLENAIKYNVQHGRIDIKTAVTADTISLTVADTGIGIPLEHHERIFERFYRVDKSRSRQMGGTGLGLAIVKHIADYHHAKIAITSKENVGTTITVAFAVAE